MSKRFGSHVALHDVSLRLEPGSFHALLGENGAGKSTLVKCVMGYYRLDEGVVSIDGVGHRIHSPLEAHACGLGMVYQHFTLVPSMSVAENLLMAQAHFSAIIDWRKEIEHMSCFLERMPFEVDLYAPVSSLAAGEKQKVEIVKQLFLDARVLILDEPTSVLTPDEANQILGLLREMTERKELSVLLITHKLREVFAFAKEVTVLREGRVTGGGPISEHTPTSLAELMVGSHASLGLLRRNEAHTNETRLELKSVSAHDDRGHTVVADLSLHVCAGEIVGIAGVSGNGQRELIEVLSGQRTANAGRILVHGEPYHATRREMRRCKMFCLPEEPLKNASVGRMSVAENLAFRQFDMPPFVTAGRIINRLAMRKAAQDLVQRFEIRTASVDTPVEVLSGGNIQRIVLARELSRDVQVLIAANPCFGLDIKAIAEIRSRIVKTRNSGAAVLLVSEDLDEILELADRILVMFEGQIVFETKAADADRSSIGRHMVGH